MYLIPNLIWDNYLARDIPDLWCGGTHVDWWLTRAASLIGAYESHGGYIDHLSHPESGASKRANDQHFRHNVREYNAWAVRNGAGVLELPARLPLIGASMSPIKDYLAWATKTSSQESQAVKFTIITACRNSAPYLPETIRSVVEQSALTTGDRHPRILHHRWRLHRWNGRNRFALSPRVDDFHLGAGRRSLRRGGQGFQQGNGRHCCLPERGRYLP